MMQRRTVIRLGLKALLLLGLGIGALLSGLVFASTALIGALGIAVVAVFATIALAPIRPWNRFFWIFRGGLLALCAVSVLLANGPMLGQLQTRLDGIARKLQPAVDEDISTREAVGVYAFGLVMAAGGAPLYPEVALEQACMYVPGPPTRHWHSDFAMEAARVRNALFQFAQELRNAAPEADEVTFQPVRVELRYGHDPYRVALALNPLDLQATARRDRSDWIIDVVGTVAVDYPARSRVSIPVGMGRVIAIEEGLFHHLQELGWLHPYDAEWAWSVSAASLLP